jgi:hypothetical protein
MPEAPKLLEPKILEPFSTCSSCIESLDDLDWVAATTFRVGEWALGVRSSNVETDAALRRVLAAHVVDTEAPPNFSALMADDSDRHRHVRAFNLLYRASDPLVRTRAPGRVLRTLLQHLSDFATTDSATVRLAATGFVAGGRAVVAPHGIGSEMAHIETRLNAAGVRVIDALVLHLDPASGELVVPEPALTIDHDALADYERANPAPRREPESVRAGRYPIAVWAFTVGPEQDTTLRPAQAVAAAAQQVVNADGFGAQQVLDVMASAIDNTRVAGMAWDDPADLANQLLALAGEHRA